jgi:hypothetical protein
VEVARPPRQKAELGVLLFCVALIIYFVNLNTVWSTDHTSTFLTLDYAIWTNHTFALGKVGSFSPSVDDFVYNGRYYSALAPGLAFFALPLVALGIVLDGGFSLYGYANFLGELFVALLNAIAVVFIYKLARLYFADSTSFFVASAYGFSTISWPFATFFFQSDASAAFAVIAVYLVIRAGRGQGELRYVILGGLAVGAALMVDYVDVILIPVLLGYLALWARRKGPVILAESTLGFLTSSLVGVIAIALYNLSSFGRALVTSEQLYLGSSTIFGNFSTPIYLGVVLNLFSPLRGIFLFSPVLVLGVLGYREMLRRSSGVAGEGALLLAAFLALFLPYCAWYGPTGGLSFGPRFVVAALPFLVLPVGFLVQRRGRLWLVVAYALYAIGVVVNGLAALTSALAGESAWLSSPFLGSTLPLFEQGTLDQWWKGSLGAYWPVGAGVVLATALILPLAAGYGSAHRGWVELTPGPEAAESGSTTMGR